MLRAVVMDDRVLSVGSAVPPEGLRTCGVRRAAVHRCWFVLLVLLGTVSVAPGQATRPTRVDWTGRAIGGTALRIPAGERPTLLLFAQAEQVQSQQAIEQVRAALASAGDVQAVLVVSGVQAPTSAKALAEKGGWTGPVALDPDYALSGQLAVYAWPTTVVLDEQGRAVAHLPGLSPTFAGRLEAYLAFALHRIDQATLDQRLTQTQVVQDSSTQAAQRYLVVGLRLLEAGRVERAHAEIEAGLHLRPDDRSLRLALGQILLRQRKAEQSLQVAEELDRDPDRGDDWPARSLHVRALIALERWEEAKGLLARSQAPGPGDALIAFHYQWGLIHQYERAWREAAECFRAAIDASAAMSGPQQR